MTREELSQAASELAASLEAAVPLATTRIEHIRVAGHASRARAIAQALQPAQEPLPPFEPGTRPLFTAQGL